MMIALQQFQKILQTDRVALSTNLLLKLDVSFLLVTGELLQKTVDVISIS